MIANAAQAPILLRIAMVLGAVFGILGTSAGVVGLLLVAMGDAVFSIDGDLVSRAEFRRLAVFFFVLYVCACITAGVASWAIWRGQARSRGLLTLLLAEFVIGDAAMLVLANSVFEVGFSELAASAFLFAVIVVVGLWYLFRKKSVVRYYAAIR